MTEEWEIRLRVRKVEGVSLDDQLDLLGRYMNEGTGLVHEELSRKPVAMMVQVDLLDGGMTALIGELDTPLSRVFGDWVMRVAVEGRDQGLLPELEPVYLYWGGKVTRGGKPDGVWRVVARLLPCEKAA